jgi:hypothetical protein
MAAFGHRVTHRKMRSSTSLFLLSLSQPDSEAAAIVVDELDTGCLERQSYFAPRLITAAQGASFQPLLSSESELNPFVLQGGFYEI